jgi:hypothetical protein
MQIKLPLHPLQQIVTGLEQADPDDMTGPFRASSIATSAIFRPPA